ncbi:hypothetical protein HDU76_009956, partial [Blyttiomyces sp. JEL0837]
ADVNVPQPEVPVSDNNVPATEQESAVAHDTEKSQIAEDTGMRIHNKETPPVVEHSGQIQTNSALETSESTLSKEETTEHVQTKNQLKKLRSKLRRLQEEEATKSTADVTQSINSSLEEDHTPSEKPEPALIPSYHTKKHEKDKRRPKTKNIQTSDSQNMDTTMKETASEVSNTETENALTATQHIIDVAKTVINEPKQVSNTKNTTTKSQLKANKWRKYYLDQAALDARIAEKTRKIAERDAGIAAVGNEGAVAGAKVEVGSEVVADAGILPELSVNELERHHEVSIDAVENVKPVISEDPVNKFEDVSAGVLPEVEVAEKKTLSVHAPPRTKLTPVVEEVKSVEEDIEKSPASVNKDAVSERAKLEVVATTVVPMPETLAKEAMPPISPNCNVVNKSEKLDAVEKDQIKD